MEIGYYRLPSRALFAPTCTQGEIIPPRVSYRIPYRTRGQYHIHCCHRLAYLGFLRLFDILTSMPQDNIVTKGLPSGTILTPGQYWIRPTIGNLTLQLMVGYLA